MSQENGRSRTASGCPSTLHALPCVSVCPYQSGLESVPGQCGYLVISSDGAVMEVGGRLSVAIVTSDSHLAKEGAFLCAAVYNVRVY